MMKSIHVWVTFPQLSKMPPLSNSKFQHMDPYMDSFFYYTKKLTYLRLPACDLCYYNFAGELEIG